MLISPQAMFTDATSQIALAGERAQQRKPRALVVDDTPDITLLFATIMEQEGYDVAMKLSAGAALEAARREQFDVVVSDIGMPGMDGYELATKLRGLPSYGTVPLIAVTGYAEYADHDRALAAGFNAHLTKPVDPTTLIEVVMRLRNPA